MAIRKMLLIRNKKHAQRRVIVTVEGDWWSQGGSNP